jgi:hypothetical protein
LKRETAAVASITVVFGGKQGIKVEIRGDRRKGGLVPARGLPVEAPVKLPDETRKGRVGLLHCGNTVQGEPDGQAALRRFPEALDTPFGLRLPAGISSRPNISAIWPNWVLSKFFPASCSPADQFSGFFVLTKYIPVLSAYKASGTP